MGLDLRDLEVRAGSFRLGPLARHFLANRCATAGVFDSRLSRCRSFLTLHHASRRPRAARSDRTALTICPQDLALLAPVDGDNPALEAGTTALTQGTSAGGPESAPGRVIAVESDGKGKLRVIVNLGVELRAMVSANDPRASALVAGARVWVRLPRD